MFSSHFVIKNQGIFLVKGEAYVKWVYEGICGIDHTANCQSETVNFLYVPFSLTDLHRCNLW